MRLSRFFVINILYVAQMKFWAIFKKANYIVTDTFHGTIFSVIFHKQFGTFCRSKSNTGSTNQEKLLDLLHRLQLENQLIKDVRNLETTFNI